MTRERLRSNSKKKHPLGGGPNKALKSRSKSRSRLAKKEGLSYMEQYKNGAVCEEEFGTESRTKGPSKVAQKYLQESSVDDIDGDILAIDQKFKRLQNLMNQY